MRPAGTGAPCGISPFFQMDGTFTRKVACTSQGSWLPSGWPNEARVVPMCPWHARIRYSSVPPVVCSSSLPSLATIAARTSSSVGGWAPVRRVATVSSTACSRTQPPESPCSSTTRVRRMAPRTLASRLGSALSGGPPLRFRGPPTRRAPSATDRAANQPFNDSGPPTPLPRPGAGIRLRGARLDPGEACCEGLRHTRLRPPRRLPERGS